MEFDNGTQLLSTCLVSPYGYTWNAVAGGSYTLTAKAYDNFGVATVSNTVNITVNAPPVCTLTSPVNGAYYSAPASVPLAATATSSAGISKVEFYNGTQLLLTSLTSPYSYNWTGVSTGNYALTARKPMMGMG